MNILFGLLVVSAVSNIIVIFKPNMDDKLKINWFAAMLCIGVSASMVYGGGA